MRAPPPPCGCVGVRRARVHVPRRVPPRGARQIAFGSCFLLQGAACSVLKSHLAHVRRAASRSPRRAPPSHAPFGAPAGRGGASPSPWGRGALYSVAVLAGCARLLPPLRRAVCPRSAVCPRRVGRAVCFRAALRAALHMRFSFPRGVRRCGAPPSSGRRYAPPPSCAFFLPQARASLPPFLPRVLSPFRECSCGMFLQHVTAACYCSILLRLNSIKIVRRNVKSEMLKTPRPLCPVSAPSLVRFNSVYYLCGVLIMFNFSPSGRSTAVTCRWSAAVQSRINHHGKRKYAFRLCPRQGGRPCFYAPQW